MQQLEVKTAFNFEVGFFFPLAWLSRHKTDASGWRSVAAKASSVIAGKAANQEKPDCDRKEHCKHSNWPISGNIDLQGGNGVWGISC